MANELTLHIDLKNIPDNTSKAQDKLAQVTGQQPQEQNVSQDLSSSEKFMKAAKKIGAVALAKQVVSTGISVAKYRVNTIGARYGDVARQNELNNVIGVGERALSIGSSTISGAVTGAAIGMGPIGAVIGLLSASINEAVSMIERNDQWRLQQDKNNFEEIRNMERLGLTSTDRNRGR